MSENQTNTSKTNIAHKTLATQHCTSVLQNPGTTVFIRTVLIVPWYTDTSGKKYLCYITLKALIDTTPIPLTMMEASTM